MISPFQQAWCSSLRDRPPSCSSSTLLSSKQDTPVKLSSSEDLHDKNYSRTKPPWWSFLRDDSPTTSTSSAPSWSCQDNLFVENDFDGAPPSLFVKPTMPYHRPATPGPGRNMMRRRPSRTPSPPPSNAQSPLLSDANSQRAVPGSQDEDVFGEDDFDPPRSLPGHLSSPLPPKPWDGLDSPGLQWDPSFAPPAPWDAPGDPLNDAFVDGHDPDPNVGVPRPPRTPPGAASSSAGLLGGLGLSDEDEDRAGEQLPSTTLENSSSGGAGSGLVGGGSKGPMGRLGLFSPIQAMGGLSLDEEEDRVESHESSQFMFDEDIMESYDPEQRKFLRDCFQKGKSSKSSRRTTESAGAILFQIFAPAVWLVFMAVVVARTRLEGFRGHLWTGAVNLGIVDHVHDVSSYKVEFGEEYWSDAPQMVVHGGTTEEVEEGTKCHRHMT